MKLLCIQQALAHAAATLVFPLIVKHPRGYGSIGLTPASKVRNGTELHTQVAMALHAWGAALVEEFVVGREATVLVVEDVEHSGVRALKPVECVFVPDGVADDVQQEKRNGQQQDGQQQQEGLSWFKDFATKFGVEDQHGGGGGIHKVTMTWKPMYSPQDTVLVNQLCSAACKVGLVGLPINHPVQKSCTFPRLAGIPCIGVHRLCTCRFPYTSAHKHSMVFGAQSQLWCVLPTREG